MGKDILGKTIIDGTKKGLRDPRMVSGIEYLEAARRREAARRAKNEVEEIERGMVQESPKVNISGDQSGGEERSREDSNRLFDDFPKRRCLKKNPASLPVPVKDPRTQCLHWRYWLM